MVALQIVWIAAAALAVLIYFGWGITRLLWPRGWQGWEWLGVPLLGYALLATADYAFQFFGINLTAATAVLIPLLAIVNLYGWRKGGREGEATARDGGTRLVWALAGVVFVISVAPLLRYGYLTLIGENWDPEFYLPLAEYLKQYTIPQLANAPANPLIETLRGRHIGPLPMGFSYLHTTVDLLFQFDALDSFPVLAAALHALSLPASYLFYRTTFKQSPGVALAATALLASSGLLLWVTFWGFGLHLASLALLPLAAALGAQALQSGQARDLPLAALALAALNVTFHPSLVAALLPLGLLGLYLLATRQARGRTLAQGAGLLALAVSFSFPTLWHLADFAREYYNRTPLATGLREFIPPSDAFGVSLYTLNLVVGQTIPTPLVYAAARQMWDLVAAPLMLLGAALGLWALWRVRTDPARRVVWWLFVTASVGYVLLFRLPFLRPYPYGFLKSLTLTIFVLTAAIAEGAAGIRDLGTGNAGEPTRGESGGGLRNLLGAGRVALWVGVGALGTVTLLTLAISLEQYFKPAPAFFNTDDLAIRAAGERLPAGASIWLTDRKDAPPLQMGLAAYALRAFPLYGRVQTGYADYARGEPGQVYDFALLARGEVAQLRGYAAAPAWSNSRWALYPKPQGLLWRQTITETLAPGTTRSMNLAVTGPLSGTAGGTGDPVSRSVALALTSLITREVTVQVGTATVTRTLAPGLTIVQTGPAPLPQRLTLGTDATEGLLYWNSVELWEPGAAVESRPAVTAAQATSRRQGDAIQTEVAVANPARASFAWTFILRGTLATGRRQEQVFLQKELAAAPERRVSVRFDPTRGGLDLAFDGRAPLTWAAAPLEGGRYRASLELYREGILRGRLDLYGLERKGGQWQVTPVEAPLLLAAP